MTLHSNRKCICNCYLILFHFSQTILIDYSTICIVYTPDKLSVCTGVAMKLSLTNKNVEQANFAQVSHELESDYARSQFNYEIEQLYMYRFRDSRAIPFGLLFISFPTKFTLASYT